MLTLWPRSASLIAAIVATLPRLDGLLLRSDHVTVLAEAPQVIWDVRTIRKDMIHLIRLIATEHT